MTQLLNDNGLSATFDPYAHTIYLNGDFTDNDTMVWSYDDLGFDGELGATFGIVGAPENVPEPASLSLLGIGATALLLRRLAK